MNIKDEINQAPTHFPDSFVIVGQENNVVILHAMCICGDDNCGFTLPAVIDPELTINPLTGQTVKEMNQ